MTTSRLLPSLLVCLSVLLGLLVVLAFDESGAEDGVRPVSPVLEQKPVQAEQPLAPAENLRDRDARPLDLHVELRPVGDLLPLPSRPAVRLLRGDTALPVAAEVLGGAAAGPRSEMVGLHLLRFQIPGSDQPTLRLLRLGRGERTVDCRIGGWTSLRGTVLGPGERPVVGAQVWIAGVVTSTDARGRFEQEEVPRAPQLPVVVTARGMASIYRAVPMEGASRELRLVMEAGASLRVRCELPEGVAATAAKVYVAPARQPRSTALLQYPFFLQALQPAVPDAAGNLVVAGLPRGIQVAVQLRHPRLVSTPVNVQVKATTPVVLRGKKLEARLAGRVLDETGKPLPEARVVVWRSGPSRERRDFGLPLAADSGVAISAECDTEGHFELFVPKGDRNVTVWAPNRARLQFVFSGPSVERDFLLPQHSDAAGDPRMVLRFAAPTGQRYRVQVRESGSRRFRGLSWQDTHAFEHRLRRPVLVDLQVDRHGADGKVRTETFRNVPIRGRSELRPLRFRE